ncbi:MAG: ATP-dependent DNA helicase RecG [Bacteroidota bacterium]
MHPIWQKDIMYLKRVGPKRAEVLASEAGIRTYGDLLMYFPRKYVDRSKVSKISEVQEGQHVSLVGRLINLNLVRGKKGRNRLSGTFKDDSGTLELTWFQGVKWIQSSLKIGEELALFGRISMYGGSPQMTHPEVDHLKNEDGVRHAGNIVPFYPSSEKLSRMGLDSRGFRGLMHQLLEEAGNMIPETIDPVLCQQMQIRPRQEAIQNIHFPASYPALQSARQRLIFEEFFFFQLLLARRRDSARLQHQAPPFTQIGSYFNTFFDQHMPFELTGAQKRVLKEIRRDLARPVQMNRLVQGDVGSGKTMVAFMTMLMAKDNGFQSAIMAPTAILAEQHYQKITAMAEKIGLTTDILVGGQKKKERSQILERIASGETDITIGTHALIEDTVQFQKLGLVVVDEQHKFGVMQRMKLWRKANPFPHNMVMTATPIPRTLAMTVYGDIEVSVIDELPPGRQPIQTLVKGESKRLEVLGFIKQQLEAGKQAYVVYPLVEESEKLDLIAAVKGHELLERYFTDFRVGIVHGKMHPEDKELEMQQFVKNKSQLLVSTTVIEVGVDVPNATVMLIEHAERFGLSQLHQLRGRVGRGGGASYCILMAGKKLSADGKTRLKAMKESTDGFRISEIDLELRGPGDFLGTRQSGLPEFQLANIIEDQEILKVARQHAFHLQESDPSFAAYPILLQALKRYLHKHAQLAVVA